MTISCIGIRAEPKICQRPVIPGLTAAGAVPALDERVLVGHERTGADEAHLAPEDVQQLRELVQRDATHEPADPRDPRILIDLEEASLRLIAAAQRAP